MTLQRCSSAYWFRRACLGVVFVITYGSAPASFNSLIRLGLAITQGEPAMYADNIVDFVDAPDASRDELGRGGIWDADSLAELGKSQTSQENNQLLPDAAGVANEGDVLGGGTDAGGGTTGSTSGGTTGTTGTTNGGSTASTTGGTTGTTTGGTGTSGTTGDPAGGGTRWEQFGPGGGAQGKGVVNTNTGNRITSVPIVDWPVRGGQLSMDLTLYHNSRGRTTALGWPKSWRSSFDITVFEDSAVALAKGPPTPSKPKIAVVTWGDGTSYKYTSYTQTAGYYTPTVGVYDKLYRSVIGWKITKKDQTVYEFNSRGYLIDIKDRNSNTITISRDPSSMLMTTITDPTNRTLTFTQSAYTNYGSIHDPLSRTWTLARSNPQNTLTSLTYPAVDGQTYSRQFTYRWDTNQPNAPILAETDLRGKVWTCDYDLSGKLSWFQDPLNNRTAYSYGASITSFSLPGTETYTHHYQSGVYVGETDPANYSDQSSVDASKNITYYRDKRGNSWGFQYDANANLTRATTPSFTAQTFTYNAKNDITSYTDDLQQSHTITYVNSNPSMDALTVGGDVVWYITYDSYGQVMSRSSGGQTQNFTYDGYGNTGSVNSTASSTRTLAISWAAQFCRLIH